MDLKLVLLSIPGVRTAAKAARRLLAQRRFDSSGVYWEERYRAGGTSGPGSYGRLAQYKAAILNDFVSEHGVSSVVELGCGDGAQLALAKYPNYTGVDVAPAAIEHCRKKFDNDGTKEFRHAESMSILKPHQLSLSLDVIYHLVEDDIFDCYMRDLFRLATEFVIIYSSNFDQTTESPHVRHREFTRWIYENQKDWTLLLHLPNKHPKQLDETDDTSHADFYMYNRSGVTHGR